MWKEQGKRLQLRFNIPNIPENKRNVERMLKQSLLNSFNIDSTSLQHVSTRKGVANALNIATQQNRKDVEANVEAVC